MQKLALRAGENAKLSLAMRAGQGVVPRRQHGVTFASYSELYPPGPGHDVIEQGCHAVPRRELPPGPAGE